MCLINSQYGNMHANKQQVSENWTLTKVLWICFLNVLKEVSCAHKDCIHPSEIILISCFDAQETFIIIINAVNSGSA